MHVMSERCTKVSTLMIASAWCLQSAQLQMASDTDALSLHFAMSALH